MTRALTAGLFYFAIVFAAGFALGIVRTFFVARAIGDLAAVLLEVPVMLLLAWFAWGLVLRTIPVPAVLAARAVVGATALALLLVAEAGVSLMFGRTLSEHVATYRTPAALVGLAAQLVYAAFPMIELRRR